MKNLSGLFTGTTLAGSSHRFGHELTAANPKSYVAGRNASALIHFGLAVAVVLAFSTVLAAQLDPREIVRRSIATWDRGSKTGRNYSYTERDVGRHLDASGVLQSEEVDVSKTIFVNGDPFQDLVEHNGAPPTPSEARKQMEKLLKRQTETKAERAARLENEKADRAFVTEVVDAFNFASSEEFVGNFDRRRVPRHSPTRW